MTVACFSPSARRIAACRSASAGLTTVACSSFSRRAASCCLHEHFLLLADLIDAGLLLGDALARDRGGERPGLLGFRLLGLHRGVELGLPRLLVAQRLRDGDVGLVALGLAFLVGHGRLDHRVALWPAPRR